MARGKVCSTVSIFVGRVRPFDCIYWYKSFEDFILVAISDCHVVSPSVLREGLVLGGSEGSEDLLVVS